MFATYNPAPQPQRFTFVGGGLSAIVAAQFPLIQLFQGSGAGNNKIIWITRAVFSTSITGDIQLTNFGIALANLHTSNFSYEQGIVASIQAQVRSGTTAGSVLGAPTNVNANAPLTFDFFPAFKVVPGTGLGAQGSVGASLTGTFFWYETG